MGSNLTELPDYFINLTPWHFLTRHRETVSESPDATRRIRENFAAKAWLNKALIPFYVAKSTMCDIEKEAQLSRSLPIFDSEKFAKIFICQACPFQNITQSWFRNIAAV
jgi:hypothetical protein